MEPVLRLWTVLLLSASLSDERREGWGERQTRADEQKTCSQNAEHLSIVLTGPLLQISHNNELCLTFLAGNRRRHVLP